MPDADLRALTAGLPYVDGHRIEIPAPRALVWTVVRRYARSSLGLAADHPFGRLLSRSLAARPDSGFEVAHESAHRRLGLAGQHRFSRYLLVFELADTATGGTLLSARTYAAFPGVTGRVYRTLVIGTRIHVVAVTRMLHTIRRRSVAPPTAG